MVTPTPTTVQVKIQLRGDTAANWAAVNPVLLTNELGLETDTKKIKVGNGSTAWNSLAYFPSIVTGGTVLGNLEIGTTGTLTFEGSTADGFETTLAVTDPTADRTITLPDQTGTVIVSGNASIADADIAANAEIAVSKLANGTVNQVLVTDGTDVSWSDDLTLAGNLTVNGTTTTVNTETLTVKDKNIELAVVETPTDVTADGGGITLQGATNKTITWSDTTDAWTFNQVVDLPAGTNALPALFFNGDVDTGIYSPGDNQLAISTSGTQRVNFGTGEVVFNETGDDYDFRIEGDTLANLVFVDASTDQVGLGTNSPQKLFELAANNNGVAENNTLRFTDTDTSTEANQQIGRIEFYSSDSSGSGANVKAYIGAFAEDTTPDAYLAFATQDESGVSTPAERLRITSDGKVGIDTVNPQALLHVQGNSTFNAPTGSGTLNIVSTNNIADAGNKIAFFGASRLDMDEEMAYIKPLLTSNSGGSGNIQTGHLTFGTSGSERLRIDSSGRLLVGTSNARSNFNNTTNTAALQVEGATFNTANLAIVRNQAGTSSGGLTFAKSRSDSLGSNTIVVSGDGLGLVSFEGSDGTEFVRAASISAAVDGTPGANDMPGRLVFSTTADGASSPDPRMTIKSSGIINISNASTYADNTAALAGGLVAGDIYRKSDGTLMITY